MKIIVIGLLFLGLLYLVSRQILRPLHKPDSSTRITQPSVDNLKTTKATASPALLQLPFDATALPDPPKSFGLYPFGLVSNEHPEGHAGLNIETLQTTPILAPSQMKITLIDSPTGRPDEHNIEADQIGGSLKFEYLRVGSLIGGLREGTVVRAGQQIALPGKNHTLGVYMFHFGVLNAQKDAICPSQVLWHPAAWQELSSLVNRSIDDTGRPYTAICVSTTPIPFAKRNIE